ncbi:MAG: hydantoinase/oxoprolinase family protein [Rhodospirillales bacterium]|nr:hydantoinase/oxoprolinase family protein [Rhodospirillales bacterium]
MSTRHRVAVDVGGTFTDLVAVDADGNFRFTKVPTTYPDYQRGVVDAVRAGDVSFEDMEIFLHGLTIATNAVVARTGARTGLVGTKGFRDLIEIRRANRPREGMYDVSWEPSPPLVPRRDRLTVAERVDYLGNVVTSVDESEARAVGRAFRKRGIESIAVSFLNAFLNPENEREMGRILREECPDASITLSSELIPVIFEFERTSTAVVNAYLEPIVRHYMDQLSKDFRDERYGGEILVMQSSGGVTTPEGAGRNAARTIMSGPAAGVIAAKALGELAGVRNIISLDMGGTSADIATIFGGEIRTTEESKIDFGIPVVFPSIDLITIGAGGGTIAWIDEGGVLKSGPASAGSAPGPACYGAGGTEATNTDANMVLGALNPEGLAGGAMKLRPELAQDAVQRIAESLGMDATKAANGIITVSNANMVQAMRQVTTERGYDPREFALVAFGGAGPLHCAELALQMSIPKVIVPPNPGLTSALGLLFADVRYDFSRTRICRADQLDCAEIEAEFAEMEATARDMLRASGFDEDRMHLQRIANFKYYGGFEAVPLSVAIEGRRFDQAALDTALARFASEHEREYNYVLDEIPVELQLIRLVAHGLIERPSLRQSDHTGTAAAAETGARDVYFEEENGFVSTKVYDRDRLLPGAQLVGPAIVEQMDSTVLIRPGMSADVDHYFNLILETGAAR